MDTKVQPVVQDEKSIKHYEEKTDLEHGKDGVLENTDYTGAQAKTDPAEIALVKKIDWRLMVCAFYLDFEADQTRRCSTKILKTDTCRIVC